MSWDVQVGYGDIVPQSTHERIYAILAMIVGGGFYGYIIASMASVAGSVDRNQAIYNEKMELLQSYMERRNFPYALRRKLRLYFKRYFEVRTALDEEAILDHLEPGLRQEVSSFLVDDIVWRTPLFADLPYAETVSHGIRLRILRLVFESGSRRVYEASDDGNVFWRAYVDRREYVGTLDRNRIGYLKRPVVA